jgi:hypothetical protein
MSHKRLRIAGAIFLVRLASLTRAVRLAESGHAIAALTTSDDGWK